MKEKRGKREEIEEKDIIYLWGIKKGTEWLLN